MIKHIRQNINKPTCGAVCIRMIFNHRKIKGSIGHIYENISDSSCIDSMRMCKNILMLRYLLKMGFQTCVVSVDKPEEVLQICRENKINVICHIRPDVLLDGFGHYVLYLDHDNKNIYINDPAQKYGRTSVKIDKFKKQLKPSAFSGVVEKNTFILVNTYKKKLPEIEIDCDRNEDIKINCFECIKDYVRKIICPEHDHFVNVKKSRK